MKVSSKVKRLPWPLGYVYKGLAYSNSVWLKGEILDDLKGSNPLPENVGVYLHEMEHVKRINRQGGNLKFFVRYWGSREFRLNEELMADKARFKYLKENGAEFDFEKRAKSLSGHIYLWPASYSKVLEELRLVWKES